MDVARALGLETRPESADPREATLVAHARERAERASGHLLAALVDEPPIADAAAALVCRVVVGERDADGRSPTLDQLAILHDVAMLALVVAWRPALLFEGIAREGYAERVGMAARGQLERPDDDEPLPAFVVALRTALAALPGWDAGAAALSAALANALETTLQEQRRLALGSAASRDAAPDGADGAGPDLVAIAAGMLLGDRSAMHHPSEVELALRLGCAAVGRARDIIAYTSGGGPLRPQELVARRFTVPIDVIRLGHADTDRCLRAMLALDVLDLADALQSIDPAEPLRRLLPRAVAALVELEPGGDALRTTTPEVDEAGIMAELRKVARLDGRITSEERALLRGMDTHLLAFGDLVARIDEDRVVDFDEFQQLRSTRQYVLDELMRIALADDVISDDERRLLVRALELLPSLRPARP